MNIFSFIKSKVSILDIVGEYAQLKKAGHYWKGHCPFHNERTASFTVSPHKEIFYCFGCHEGGDAVTFIAQVEQCSPVEAAHFIAERYNIELPSDLSNEKSAQVNEGKKQYFELCKAIALWTHENLRKNPSVLHYLKKRGFDNNSIDYFTVGYFPGGLAAIKALVEHMNKKNILSHDLIKANIVSQGKTVLYSPFENRVIFPIKDHLGRFCGFGGRVFKQNDERAKYYNSRENDFFSKGSLLFGLDLAKNSIKETSKAFLVEGYTDCIAMVQHGMPNTVATLGTACTLEHLTQLSRYAEELYVVYDSDAAGQKAILRLTQLCWQVDVELKVICLPAGQDPATFLQQTDSLETLITQAKDIFSFFISTTASGFANKNLHQKLQVTRQLINMIATIENPLKQDILLQKAAETLQIPFESLKHELAQKKVRPKKPTNSAPDKEIAPSQENALNEAGKLEKKIFFAIMNNIQLLDQENGDYLTTYLPEPLRTILKKLSTLQQEYSSLEFTQFFDALDTAQQQLVSKLLLQTDVPESNFDQLLMQLQRQHWKTAVSKIKKDLAQADEQQAQQILHEFLALKKKLLSRDLI